MLSQEEVEDIEKVSSKSLSRSTDPSNIPQVYPPSALGYFELVVEACEKSKSKSNIEIDLNRECYIFSSIISFASFNIYIVIISYTCASTPPFIDSFCSQSIT